MRKFENIFGTEITKFCLMQAGENVEDTNTERSGVAGPCTTEKIQFFSTADGTIHEQPWLLNFAIQESSSSMLDFSSNSSEAKATCQSSFMQSQYLLDVYLQRSLANYSYWLCAEDLNSAALDLAHEFQDKARLLDSDFGTKTSHVSIVKRRPMPKQDDGKGDTVKARSLQLGQAKTSSSSSFYVFCTGIVVILSILFVGVWRGLKI